MNHCILSGLKLQNTIHWIKSISIKDRTYGHFKPVNSKKYLNNCHEYIFHFTKQEVEIDRLAVGVEYQDKSNIKRFSGNTKRCRGNTWFIPYSTRQKQLTHPATFPLEIPENCIKLHGGRDLVVLDPFCGVGTTGLAAKKLGHKFIGFEISKNYYDEAIATLSD